MHFRKDHGGGLLDNLMGYLGGGIPAPQEATRETNGGGILGHIFGTNQTQVAQEVSQNTGLDMGQVAQLLITLAPIVMSYLGKQNSSKIWMRTGFPTARRTAAADSAIAAEQSYQQHFRPRRRRFGDGRSGFDGV